METLIIKKRGRPRKYESSDMAKQAEREYNKKYYQQHKKEMIQSISESRAKRKDEIKEYKRQYYQQHKQEMIRSIIESRAKRHHEIEEYKKQYYPKDLKFKNISSEDNIIINF